jgi:hypothetical protein
MIRFGSLILGATLASALLACGSNTTSTNTADTSTNAATKNAIDLAPLDQAVSGWAVNAALNTNGSAQPMIANTKAQAEALIDGGASPFYKAPFTPKEFLWQNYINDTLPAALPQGATVVLYILHMPSADQASGLYTALLQESEYSGQTGTTNDWQPTSPRLGAESRIENTVTAWWVNFHQDVFYVEVMLTPSYGPPPDDTPDDVDLKNEAMRFAQAVASKI